MSTAIWVLSGAVGVLVWEWIRVRCARPNYRVVLEAASRERLLEMAESLVDDLQKVELE